jgi:hypothetical protein
MCVEKQAVDHKSACYLVLDITDTFAVPEMDLRAIYITSNLQSALSHITQN